MSKFSLPKSVKRFVAFDSYYRSNIIININNNNNNNTNNSCGVEKKVLNEEWQLIE